MREIKFRLLSPANKIVGYEKWYSGSLDSKNFWNANLCWLYSKDNKNWNPTFIRHRYKDQYIGRNDKNGVEIFKNDVLKKSGNKKVCMFDNNRKVESKHWSFSKVVFIDGDFKTIIFAQDNSYFGKLPSSPQSIFKSEIYSENVGNIHKYEKLLIENPELGGMEVIRK